MVLSQPFTKGERVMVPSLKRILRQACEPDEYFSEATIIYAHPTNGWCSFRYDAPAIVASAFNTDIASLSEFTSRRNEFLQAVNSRYVPSDEDDAEDDEDEDEDDDDDECVGF